MKGGPERLDSFEPQNNPSIGKRCGFCQLPEQAHKDLADIRERNLNDTWPKGGKWSSLKAWAYFKEEYGYRYTINAFRNHIYLCMGWRWV